MEVDQDDCKRGNLADDRYLETGGAATCIGVAIVHKNSGILLHSEHVIFDEKSCIAKFRKYISAIPPKDRTAIRPLVFGGSKPDFFAKTSSASMHKESDTNRDAILRILSDAGFGKPQEEWAEPDQSHSVCIDLETGDIEFEIDSDTEELTKRFHRCDGKAPHPF